MKKLIIITISIIALAAIADRFYLRAQARGWRTWHDGAAWGWQNENIDQFSERAVALLARHLDLTDEQQVQINQIISAERPAIEPLIKQLAQTSKQLRETSADGQFYEAKVRQLAAQQSTTLAELIVAKERVKWKVFAVLTPEQRARANQMLERFSPRLHFDMWHCPGRAG